MRSELLRSEDFFPDLSEPADSRNPGVLGGVVLLAYLFVALSGVVAHEPWFDEAQSWLLARDTAPAELVGQYLRYEGHPPLWYFLLMPAAKLGLPYGTANVISVLCSALGVWLFLRLPGIPLPVRCLLPFAYFVAYQYSVVARSYALVFPLLMVILHLYRERREKVIGFSVALVLLSQVSLHGLALAWAFAGLYALEMWARQGPLRGGERLRHGISAVLLLGATAAMVWMLLPPDDLLIAHRIDWVDYPARLMQKAPLISTGLAGQGMLSVLLWGTSLAWFWRRRTLAVYLATTAAVWAVAGVYANYWHEGLFFLVWAFTALLTLQRAASPVESWGREKTAALVLVLIVLGINLRWTAAALGREVETSYSASEEAALYLRSHGYHEQKVFAFGFPSLALQPYFEHNLYANYRTRGGFTFWDWSESTPLFFYDQGRFHDDPTARRNWQRYLRAWFEEQVAAGPDVIVVSQKFHQERLFMDWLAEDSRYRLEREIPGALIWKGGRAEDEGFAIWVRREPAGARSSPVLNRS